MDKYRQISELMKGFQRGGQVFFPATVESVEGVTCTVNVDGLSISDVRLKPTTDETVNAILITPEDGSEVLVGSLSGDLSNLFVAHVNSVSEVSLNVGEISFKLDKNEVALNGGDISFKLDKNGIVLNDGEISGLAKLPKLVEWMQKVYGDLQMLKTLLQSHPVAGNGAPLALPFNFTTPDPDQSTFEDEKVKH